MADNSDLSMFGPPSTAGSSNTLTFSSSSSGGQVAHGFAAPSVARTFTFPDTTPKANCVDNDNDDDVGSGDRNTSIVMTSSKPVRGRSISIPPSLKLENVLSNVKHRVSVNHSILLT